jgi:hypothetical protein
MLYVNGGILAVAVSGNTSILRMIFTMILCVSGIKLNVNNLPPRFTTRFRIIILRVRCFIYYLLSNVFGAGGDPGIAFPLYHNGKVSEIPRSIKSKSTRRTK